MRSVRKRKAASASEVYKYAEAKCALKCVEGDSAQEAARKLADRVFELA